MARIRLIAASLGTALAAGVTVVATAGGPAAAAPAPAAAAPAPAGVTAHVWVTTPDGTDKFTSLAPATFGSATAPTAPAIVVDPTLTYQTMQGFGGAITDSSATVLYRLSPAARAATMRSLFDPVTGDGLDYLRQPIGASDSSPPRTTPTTTGRPDRPITRRAISPSSTTRRRSCRCCARPRR